MPDGLNAAALTEARDILLELLAAEGGPELQSRYLGRLRERLHGSASGQQLMQPVEMGELAPGRATSSLVANNALVTPATCTTFIQAPGRPHLRAGVASQHHTHLIKYPKGALSHGRLATRRHF